jgi:4-amino-4-deoxy-L-arabinose transferase-like glycosyltransferase
MTAVIDVPSRLLDRGTASRRPGLVARFIRGRRDDPAWVRPALLTLLVVTGWLYIWDLGASGWANSFYAAAVRAGTKSWKAMFFGSFDSSNFITVDKSPASLWIMELSARIFGFSSWSMLVPQALEGVATVGVVYLTVRRWFPPAAGLAAGVVVALTPVAALMFRYNNPDALMVLCLAVAAYATTRAIEDGRTRWVVTAGAFVGFGFLAKMLQAFLVVPAFALVFLVAAPGPLSRRIRQLLYGGLALVVAAGWWVAAVQLTPRADRPYIGGSQNNSLWNLMFGYNGFGRITGNETGSVGGGGGGGNWGPTGLTRLFNSSFGTQVSWLLPAALILLVAGLIVTWRAPRTNRARAGLFLWGGWLVVTGLTFSLSKGIIHPYYTVALAPAIGGVIGVGGFLMWVNRRRWVARAILAVAVAATAVWAYVLLDRTTPNWLPWLRPLVLTTGLIAAAGLLAWPFIAGGWRKAMAAGALVACLGAPLAYTLDTVRTAHDGALPSAGPVSTVGLGLRGGAPGRQQFGGGGFPGGQRFGGPPANAFGPGGASAGTGGVGPGTGGGITPGAGARTGGAGGGLLNASTPSAALKRLLETNASRYTWVVATVGANEAAGYQLATGDPVMAIGGFNGTDPYPTLAQFERLVSEGRIHYFIAGGFGGGPGAAGSSSDSQAITSWVESHFDSTTVGGVAVYDLTSPATG